MVDDTNELIFMGGGGLTPNLKFSIEYSPDNCVRKFDQIKTAKDVLTLSSDIYNPTIVSIRKERGVDFIEAYIEKWLEHMNNFLNIKRKMNSTQMNQTAKLIIEEYYMLTLADIKIVFTNALKGKYSNSEGQTFYQSFDGADVMRWFMLYFEHRVDTAENINSSRPQLADTSRDSKAGVAEKYIAEIKERLNEKMKKKRIENISTIRRVEKRPVDKLVEMASDINAGVLDSPSKIAKKYNVSIEFAEECYDYFSDYDGVFGLIEAKFNNSKEYKLLHSKAVEEFKNAQKSDTE